jgi:hypothetical protein
MNKKKKVVNRKHKKAEDRAKAKRDAQRKNKKSA